MKITIFNGSPRGERGNTHAIATEFMRGSQMAGAEVENCFLVEKSIHHCRGCFVCWTQTPGECVIQDDMAELLGKIRGSDVVVFATPLYVDNVTGIMKNFMDRLIPLIDCHFEKDAGGECKHPPREGGAAIRKLVVIANSGFPEQSQFQVLRLLFRRIARNTGAELAGEIYRGGGELFSAKNILVSALLLRYRKVLQEAGKEVVLEGRIRESTTMELEKPLMSDALYIRGANKYWERKLAKNN
jgi:putative NADPH-quinone reductase